MQDFRKNHHPQPSAAKPDTSMNFLGPYFRDVRCQRGMSHQQLADALDAIGHKMTAAEVVSIEQQERMLNDIEMLALMQVLNVSPADVQAQITSLDLRQPR